MFRYVCPTKRTDTTNSALVGNYEFLRRRKTGEEIKHTVHQGANEIIAWSMRSSRPDLYPCAHTLKDLTGAILWHYLLQQSSKTLRLSPSHPPPAPPQCPGSASKNGSGLCHEEAELRVRNTFGVGKMADDKVS